jgi:hypothetical protein
MIPDVGWVVMLEGRGRNDEESITMDMFVECHIGILWMRTI